MQKDRANLKERLKDHEGFRSEIYKCPAGHYTIGCGHLVCSGGCRISREVADLILDEDIHKATFEYLSLGWDHLSQVRQDVCREMIFWFGLKGFLKFKRMVAAIERSDWQKAADEMLDSQAGRNYRARMTELAILMIEG